MKKNDNKDEDTDRDSTNSGWRIKMPPSQCLVLMTWIPLRLQQIVVVPHCWALAASHHSNYCLRPE